MVISYSQLYEINIIAELSVIERAVWISFSDIYNLCIPYMSERVLRRVEMFLVRTREFLLFDQTMGMYSNEKTGCLFPVYFR